MNKIRYLGRVPGRRPECKDELIEARDESTFDGWIECLSCDFSTDTWTPKDWKEKK